jgi:hypothetical protein
MRPRQLFPSPQVRLLTIEELVMESRVATSFPAVRIEDQGCGAVVSVGQETFTGADLPFRDVAFDVHGTIEAAGNFLRKHFWWERVAPEIVGMELSAFRLRVRNYREEGFELFVIAHWEGWNTQGVTWEKRNGIVRRSGECGWMQVNTFVQRCHRMGLIYGGRQSNEDL